MSNTVVVERDGSIARIRLNRPEVLNALDPSTLRNLTDALASCVNSQDVRAIILTGGDKAFCAGDDLRSVASLSSQENRNQFQGFQEIARLIHGAKIPVIAAIAGVAAGGGLEIALNCDLRVAAIGAKFSTPEARWGLTVTNGASVQLARIVGDGWAREMILFGRTLDSETALMTGLITRRVPVDELQTVATNIARDIAETPSGGLSHSKGLLNADPMSWKEVLEAELHSINSALEEAPSKPLSDFLGQKGR